jgi:hypothetical protein
MPTSSSGRRSAATPIGRPVARSKPRPSYRSYPIEHPRVSSLADSPRWLHGYPNSRTSIADGRCPAPLIRFVKRHSPTSERRKAVRIESGWLHRSRFKPRFDGTSLTVVEARIGSAATILSMATRTIHLPESSYAMLTAAAWPWPRGAGRRSGALRPRRTRRAGLRREGQFKVTARMSPAATDCGRIDFLRRRRDHIARIPRRPNRLAERSSGGRSG